MTMTKEEAQKAYDELVASRKQNVLTKSKEHPGRIEIHHIIPTSMNGLDVEENKIALLAKEHFMAHVYLWIIHHDDEFHDQMLCALMNMHKGTVNGNRKELRDFILMSEDYQQAREEFGKLASKILSEANKGEKNPHYGKHWYKDPNSKAYGLFNENEQPIGWIRGKYLTENERILSGSSGKGKVWIRSLQTNKAIRVDKETAAKLISNGTYVKGSRILSPEEKERIRCKCLETRLANKLLKEVSKIIDNCITCEKSKNKTSYNSELKKSHKKYIESKLQNYRIEKTKELIKRIDSQQTFDCSHNKWYDGVVKRKQVKIYLEFNGHNQCECCGKKDIKLTVHAKDGNCRNLSINNYELLCRECYLKSGTAGFTGHSMKEINQKKQNKNNI